MIQQAIIGAQGQPLIVVDSADFDGTNDYMTRGAGLSGAADSKTGILSLWLRLDGGNAASMFLLTGSNALGGGTSDGLRLTRDGANNLVVSADNAAGSGVLYLSTVNTYVASATWLHILSSWNLATPGTGRLYINDVSDYSESVYTNDTIDYTKADWAVGALASGTSKLNGAVAELYFAPGQYLDFSLVANRRKFISASGKPVHLGATGALPTGTAPLIYHHLDDGEAVANFATNRGTGGNFTITGTLDTGSTSPSD
jgi:concanavalin A-like lectin/glucanase superfamily protein